MHHGDLVSVEISKKTIFEFAYGNHAVPSVCAWIWLVSARLCLQDLVTDKKGTVDVALFTLASSGVDLQEVLSAQSGTVDFVNLQHWLMP